METKSSNRDSKLDSLKFLLVCLVVVGHVVGLYKNQSFNLLTKNIIYLFHIPLFVYISGYLSKNKHFNWGWHLIESYLVFQTLYLIINGVSFPVFFKDLLIPVWLMWYIFSLLVWRYIKFFVIDKLHFIKPLGWIGLSLVISLASGFIPISYPLSFQRTCVFFPLFILGLFTPKEFFYKIKSFNKVIAGIVLMIVCVSLICFNVDLSAVVSGSDYYPLLGEQTVYSAIIRLFFILLSCIMGICVISLCPENSFWAKQGKNSLIYYLYHGFLVILLQFIIEKLGLPVNTAVLLLYSLIIIVFLLLLSKLEIVSIIANPITGLKKHKNEKNNNQCR